MNILLVEDNPADVRLIQEILKDVQIPTFLNTVDDGEYCLFHAPLLKRIFRAPAPTIPIVPQISSRGKLIDRPDGEIPRALGFSGFGMQVVAPFDPQGAHGRLPAQPDPGAGSQVI